MFETSLAPGEGGGRAGGQTQFARREGALALVGPVACCDVYWGVPSEGERLGQMNWATSAYLSRTLAQSVDF